MARDRRNTSVLASASVIRWLGRRLWRSFFLVMFALALGLLVLTLTSAPVFTRVSALLGNLWPDAPLVADVVSRDLAAESEGRAAAQAEAEALARRLAETEAALAESAAGRVAAE
ncbi:hypothetical protein HKCCSP123_18905, partial [Rhodobacterales bacterium HKCCSP123]|nr:hypothetical protein [Rhodobacterales bacterium HKCCSP123]